MLRHRKNVAKMSLQTEAIAVEMIAAGTSAMTQCFGCRRNLNLFARQQKVNGCIASAGREMPNG